MRKLCIIVTGLFCTLLFTTCKQYSADIEGDLSYWAAVVTARGVTCDKPSQINTSGVQCIPSATDVAFALKVRNPKNFTLVTPTSSADAVRVIRFPHLSPPPVYGTDYTLQQTASDTLTLVYKSGFLKAHERSRGNIGPEITFISTDGRVFSERFNLNIEANTPPPKPTAVLAQTNAVAPLQPTYVLCLQVPDMGISVSGGKLHGDIAQIEINGTSYPLTVSGGDFVKPTDAHFITNTSSPPTVTQLTGSASVPTGSWVLYYDTGLAVGQPYQAYTVKLKDNKGLVSETLETGTARPQLAAETVTVTRGEQGSGSGASDSTPIIINGAASAPETQITIAHGTPGTTVHCTVQEVVGGSVTGSVSPYNGNPVNVPLGLHGATEKLYKVEYHTEGTGYTPSSTTTKYYKVLKCYNVTFNANNGAFPGGLAQYTVRVPHGTFAAVPSGTNEPNKTGYHVDGWYTEAACTTQWNFSTQTITGDKQLYAKWAPNSGTSYRVEHYKEDLTENQYTSPPQIENPTGTTGASISVTHNNYPGFQVDRQDPPSATIAADGSTVVKVYYKRKTVNVTFNPNGGTISGSMANVTLSGRFGAALTPPSPVKTGYHLNPSSEWNPVSPAPALGSSPYIFPAANGTYQANWAPNTNTPYTVKHLQQDVTGSGYTEVTADRQTLQGTTGTNVAVTSKTYTGFKPGTYTSTTIAGNGSTVVEVKYDRMQYTVSFNANGGTPAPSTQSVRYEGKVTEPSTMSKTGYTFGGWYKSYNYTGTAWNFASDQVISYTNLYAKWTANTYKVHFDGNGHTGGSMPDQTFTYDEASKPLSQNTFTKTDYRFTGWTTSPGSSTVVHTDKKSVNNLTAAPNGTFNLYAVWVPLPKVTFKVEGGRGGKLKCTYDGTTQEASGNTEKYFIVEYSTAKSAAFTAEPDLGWILEKWYINPGPFNDGSQSNALQRAVTRIVSDVIVTVKFHQL